MASLYRRLHRIFTPTRSSPLPPPTTTSKSRTKRSKSSKTALPSELFKERNLNSLVNKFKIASDSYRFRSRHGVYKKIVLRLARAKRFLFIQEIIEHQKQYNDITNEGFAVRLISLYGQSGMFENALKMFDELPDLKCGRTVMSFNALLSACVNSKKFDMVDELFRELPSKLSIDPDLISFNIVIKALCEMGSLDNAVSMLDEMEERGLQPNLVTFNTILNEFYGNSQYGEGEKIWDRMEKCNVIPDVRSYNAKLRGMTNEKRMTGATELFDEMVTKGLIPDVFSFQALIKGFCDEGNLGEAKRWYRELLKSDCEPVRMTFDTLVPFVCEKGDYDTGFELCKEIIDRRCVVKGGLLQLVVDGLVKESKVEKAKEIVDQVNTENFVSPSLKMPVED